MRRTRARHYTAGLAAIGAAALTLPLLAAAPAQAAPAADLSITKTVASLAPPITFSPAFRDVRGTSFDAWVIEGLHIKTFGWTDEDKVGEYAATNTPLAAVGEPSLDYTTISGAIPPGFVLKVDVTGDGVSDGELVGESAYNGVWWLNDPRGNPGTFAAFTLHAPTCTALGTCSSTGNGWDGTLNNWRNAFPSATVVGFGFGLGSGVQGEGIVTALDFAGTHYDLRRSYQSSIKAAPGETVEYKLAIANSGDAAVGASGITINDTLPADLTYVPGSLSRPDWCSFAGRTLTCSGGSLPVGSSSNVYFKATLSNTITSDGLQSTIGHNVDVQKQEVFADLPANQTRSYDVWCPSGYLPTDGGLLVDSVDQGGFYSDIIVTKSKPAAQGGIKGWTVTVKNTGDERGQGKAKVTCLDESIGSANGHQHDIVVTSTTVGSQADATPGTAVTRTCPAGYVPVGAWYDVSSAAVVTVRAQYALANQAYWAFDYEPGLATFTFGASCLAAETTSSGGHTATLALTRTNSSITVGPESRTEGVQQCGQLAHAITGGYEGTDATVLSLGREQRGTNYMFRFYNDDWEQAWNAGIQVQCVGVRTPDERTYYRVTNTAYVTASTPDSSSADNSSSAEIKVDGEPVLPPGGAALAGSGLRTAGGNGNIKFVGLTVTCETACTFSVKVLKNGVVVAKMNKSLPASPLPKLVNVPTTSAGKNLGHGPVTVKLKTDDGTITKTVTLS